MSALAAADGCVAAIPVSIGIAISKHRLFDIDLVISRTVLFVVMAALNIAHELLRQQSENEVLDRTVGDQIRSLQDKVDQALSES